MMAQLSCRTLRTGMSSTAHQATGPVRGLLPVLWAAECESQSEGRVCAALPLPRRPRVHRAAAQHKVAERGGVHHSRRRRGRHRVLLKAEAAPRMQRRALHPARSRVRLVLVAAVVPPAGDPAHKHVAREESNLKVVTAPRGGGVATPAQSQDTHATHGGQCRQRRVNSAPGACYAARRRWPPSQHSRSALAASSPARPGSAPTGTTPAQRRRR